MPDRRTSRSSSCRPARGRRSRSATRVEVSPATVKREEHGFIRGRVVAISELPATKLAMEAALEHPELVDTFLEAVSRRECCSGCTSSSTRGPAPMSAAARAVRLEPQESLPMVVVLGAGTTAQDRHDVPGRDRGREAQVDPADPALDQDASSGPI